MVNYASIFKRITDYRENGEFCDITFDVAGTKFPSHKVILSAASNYFEKMFKSDLIKPEQSEVMLEGMTSSAFRSCIDFIYEQDIDVKASAVCEVYQAACMLQLKELEAKCIDKILSIIDINNCIKFNKFARTERCSKIELKTCNVMLENGEKIFTNNYLIAELDKESLIMMLKATELQISDESVAFQALVKWTDMDQVGRMANFCSLLQLVRLPLINKEFFTSVVHSNGHLESDCADCKKYMQSTIMHFIDGKDHGFKTYQVGARKGKKLLDYSAMAAKFSHSDFPSTSNSKVFQDINQSKGKAETNYGIKKTSTLETKKKETPGSRPTSKQTNGRRQWNKSHNVSNETRGVQDNSIAKIKTNANNEWQLLKTSKPSGARKSSSDDTEIVVFDDRKCDLKSFSVMHDKIYDKTSIEINAFPRDADPDYSSIIHLGNAIYVIKNGGRRVYCCKYKESKVWSKLEPMPQNHIFDESSIVGSERTGKIFVIGGIQNDSCTNSVSSFCANKNIWKSLLPMQKSRCNATVVMAEGLPFAIGGASYDGANYSPMSTVEVWVRNKWGFVPSLNQKRQRPASACVNDKIIIAGGFYDDILRSVETYRPGDPIWTIISSLHVARSEASMFVYRDKLFIFGGKRDKESLYEAWNESSQQWELSGRNDNRIKSCKVLLCKKSVKKLNYTFFQ